MSKTQKALKLALNWLEGMASDLGKFENEVPAIHAVREAMAEQSKKEWQPIHTAPKDGKWIITANKNNTVIPNYWLGSEINHWAKSDFNDHPTYWMPLPSPPPQGGKL